MSEQKTNRRRGFCLLCLLFGIVLLGACVRAAAPAGQVAREPAGLARAEAFLEPPLPTPESAAEGLPAALRAGLSAAAPTLPPPSGDASDCSVTFTDAEIPAEPTACPEGSAGADLAGTPVPGPTPTYRYETDAVTIEITQCNAKNLVYFAVELWLTDPAQLRSAFASDRFDGATEAVEDVAERNGAILAINGDFATFNNGGIILRNGEVFRANKSTRHLLVIDKNGDFIPYVTPPSNPKEAAAEFVAEGVWQTIVFGPLLVENGEAVELPKKFFISTGATHEPRTAIGQIGPLHYLILVVDGRLDGYSQGVSLARLQELFLEHGVKTAFNLDGGGSTTLFFNGNIVNRPSNGGQRHVSDILYVPR